MRETGHTLRRLWVCSRGDWWSGMRVHRPSASGTSEWVTRACSRVARSLPAAWQRPWSTRRPLIPGIMTLLAVFLLVCQAWEQEPACKQKEPPPHTVVWTGCGHHQQRDQTRHFQSIWLSLTIWFEGNTWDLNSHDEQLFQTLLVQVTSTTEAAFHCLYFLLRY